MSLRRLLPGSAFRCGQPACSPALSLYYNNWGLDVLHCAVCHHRSHAMDLWTDMGRYQQHVLVLLWPNRLHPQIQGGDPDAAASKKRNMPFREVECLAFSFKSLAKVQNLRGLDNLSKLQLDNNQLTKIENLGHLVSGHGRPPWLQPADALACLCNALRSAMRHMLIHASHHVRLARCHAWMGSLSAPHEEDGF